MKVEQSELTFLEMGIPNETVGEKLANSDNVEQAEFFNSFAKNLKELCKSKVHNQLDSISEELTEEARKMIVQLAVYCEDRFNFSNLEDESVQDPITLAYMAGVEDEI